MIVLLQQALLIQSMNLGSRQDAKANQRYAGGFPDSQATGVAKIRILKIKGRKFHTSIQQHPATNLII
ncbi:hypothetical protein [Scytonema sp. PCC 10023]|uniref:hypothetical protein n=1 Tax=Scytonema sp. PCC 10023 TaxID=1680591 RepID=UPI0039C72631